MKNAAVLLILSLTLTGSLFAQRGKLHAQQSTTAVVDTAKAPKASRGKNKPQQSTTAVVDAAKPKAKRGKK